MLSCVAESGQKEDTARLIQLVLGIAINCDQKDSECNLTANSFSEYINLLCSLYSGHHGHATRYPTCGDGSYTGREYFYVLVQA